ncbi:MAG: peroxidase family protein [Planctomycetaceae bacterium]
MKTQATQKTSLVTSLQTVYSRSAHFRILPAVPTVVAALAAILAPPRAPTADAQGPPADDYRVQLTEIRSIDGTGNSPGGEANAPLLRMAPADYPDDGSGETIVEWPLRENPRTISNIVVKQTTSVPNRRRRNDYLWAWGQFLDHDLDLTSAHVDNGTADIDVVDAGDLLAPGPLFFSRSDFAVGTGTLGVPRRQHNEITAFIDASNVYGSDDTRAAALRTFIGGQLKTSAGDMLPFNVDGLPNAGGTGANQFLAGDVRANENIMLTSMHTLFVREHNRLATLIALRDPLATDEEIYQLARKIVGCEMQLITYQEFLPALMGPYAPVLSDCLYEPGTNPAIANEFSTALFRFGHSLLSPQLRMDGAGLPVENIPLRNAFFNPAMLTSNLLNADRLLIGASRGLCQDVDNQIVEDVRSFLFGPPGAGGMDLATLNIQRGRDHGLPDYNTLRAAYGLSKVNSFNEISSKAAVRNKLASVYANVDEIDPWVGGLAEDHLPGANIGALLAAALSDQFLRVIKGDHFSFVNDPDLDQDLVRALIDLSLCSMDDVLRCNTTSPLMTNDIFSVDGAVMTDVVATYNADDNRIHISGNSRGNYVALVETPLGMLIHGLGITRINGGNTLILPTGLNPHVTVSLGTRNDRVYVFACDLGDVTVAFGNGDDILLTFFSSVDSLCVDGGPGTDHFNTPLDVPAAKKRVLNIP